MQTYLRIYANVQLYSQTVIRAGFVSYSLNAYPSDTVIRSYVDDSYLFGISIRTGFDMCRFEDTATARSRRSISTWPLNASKYTGSCLHKAVELLLFDGSLLVAPRSIFGLLLELMGRDTLVRRYVYETAHITILGLSSSCKYGE